MENNTLFKPSPLYKELMILNIISKDNNVSQRDLASTCNMSLSMVNSYLEEAKNKGYISVSSNNKRVVYSVTKKGKDRIKVLDISLLKSSLDIYNSAKVECLTFLKSIILKGYKNILFYGAGEVAEILLYVLNNSDININVLGIIDDDILKQNTKFVDIDVISINDINKYDIDGILVSSYTNTLKINKNLIDFGFDKTKIINFFE